MPLSPAQITRNRIAGRKRHDPNADTADLEREMQAAKLEAAVARAVAKFGPLTEQQRAKLAALLRPSHDHHGDRAA